ncbi:MAG: S-protein secretion component [Capsulimonas sp.]|jgi:hypothetical protein|nr:S-protein secretion component [Capsulimonas sp.]
MHHRHSNLRRWTAFTVSAQLICTLGGAHASPAAPADAGSHELALRAATPQSVIETFHWNKPENLPEGVTSVAAAPAGKALVVVGTDTGFHNVQEMVQMLDVPERSVQMRVQFVSAKTWDVTSSGVPLTLLGKAPDKKTAATIMAGADTRIQQASGDGVAKLLAALTKSGGSLSASTVTAVCNTEVSANLSAAPKLPLFLGGSVFITPRVNEDNSITLFLRPVVTRRSITNANKEEVEETKLVAKVGGGEPILIGNLARGGGRIADQELLVFITPTIANDKP